MTDLGPSGPGRAELEDGVVTNGTVDGPTGRRPGRRLFAGLALAALLGPAAEGLDDPSPTPGQAPAPLLPEAYREILEDPKIAGALVWDGTWVEGSGPRSYPDWDPARRDELHRALAGRAGGEAPAGPPTVTEGRWLAEPDAWAVFLRHAAHALRLEAGHGVPWSLRSLTPDQLALLLDGRRLLTRDEGRTRYAFGVAGEVTDWNPEATLAFLREQEILAPTQEETVYAFADWVRRSVRPPPTDHAHSAGSGRHYGYPGPPPVERILEPSPSGPHGRTVPGCHGLSGLFAAALRSANVPVSVAWSRFARPGGTITLHSRVELPTLGRGLPHSAELYLPFSLPSGNAIPTATLFPTLGWIRDHVDSPRHFDCDGTDCHREAEQALYNAARRLVSLAAAHLPDGLLIDRARDPSASEPPERLYEVLSEGCTRHAGAPFVRPLFEDAERREIARRADEEIVRAGGGDWERGAEAVRRRWERFLEQP